MKYLLLAAFLVFIGASVCLAWDGFDADTADLVEIIPDAVPTPGSAIDIRDYDTGETQTCLVESITRNSRTIEVVAKCPGKSQRTLVMEFH